MYRFINAEGTAVVHLLTSRCIYLDQPVTVHSEAYLAWVAEGNAADSYVAPPVIPPAPVTSISPRQIRQALTRAGLRPAVEAAVAASSQDLKDWWEFSTVCERDNEHVISMATALGVTDAQLDDLWTLGATL